LVYYESIKRELKIRGINKCRCDERLQTKTKEFKLLVKADGSPLNTVNSITRILNKIFGKKIGSSMLRHIYLSSKYGDTIKEMEKDGVAMAHSSSVQREYIKTD
jgi:hypothetical protein